MKRKVIPKKRIGPEMCSWERSIRVRLKRVKRRALNAAERSTCSDRSVSLCGTCLVMEEPFYWGKGKKRNKKEKEVVNRRRINEQSEVAEVANEVKN